MTLVSCYLSVNYCFKWVEFRARVTMYWHGGGAWGHGRWLMTVDQWLKTAPYMWNRNPKGNSGIHHQNRTYHTKPKSNLHELLRPEWATRMTWAHALLLLLLLLLLPPPPPSPREDDNAKLQPFKVIVWRKRSVGMGVGTSVAVGGVGGWGLIADRSTQV